MTLQKLFATLSIIAFFGFGSTFVTSEKDSYSEATASEIVEMESIQVDSGNNENG